MVQLSHPHVATGKTMALTVRTFVSRVMALLFNTLSRLVTAFLPRSKCLFISWLQSPCAQENKIDKLNFISEIQGVRFILFVLQGLGRQEYFIDCAEYLQRTHIVSCCLCNVKNHHFIKGCKMVILWFRIFKKISSLLNGSLHQSFCWHLQNFGYL